MVGLIHLGFDEQALTLIERFRGEPWFSTNYDVNFYAGSLLYRYHRFAEGGSIVAECVGLHPDAFSRLWLAMALYGQGGADSVAEARTIFKFGEHVGGGSPGELPFRDIADELGLRRSGLVGALSFIDVNNDHWMDLLNQSAYGVPELRVFEPGTGFVRQSAPVLEDSHNTRRGPRGGFGQ